MKHLSQFLTGLLWLSSIIYVTAQDNITRKVLLTLQPEESIVTNESCLNFTSVADQLYLVTWMDKQLYIYENGIRKGPFKSVDEVKPKDCGEQLNSVCAVYNQPEQNTSQEYMGMNDDGTYNILLNGKTYGPFKMIYNLYVSPDKSRFIAIMADEMMKFTLVTSTGIQKNLDGTFERLMISPSGQQYLVLVKETAAFDISSLSNKSEEELLRYMQEYNQNQQNAGEPQTQILGTDGKLIGKYKTADLYSNNPAYCQTGGDNWYMIIDNALYVNGQLIKQFDTDISASTCKVWISKDGKRFALVGYDKIVFSDGKIYPPPIKLEVEHSGAKTLLKWISLENEKDLVSYSKEL